jgi:LEM3 (ligand-effect modulator 3) family / CDC50 family
MLPAWRPVPSYGSTMTIFVVFGVIFLTLGITLYVMSDRIQMIEVQYNTVCPATNGESKVCSQEIIVEKEMLGPIYVYYELGNFYQNHRRYVKSRSYKQLMGEEVKLKDAAKQCDPVVTNKDMNKEFAHDKVTRLDPEKVAIPCGLIAKSVFNDTYMLSRKEDFSQGGNIVIDDSDIAWKSDVDFKFKN